MKALTILLTLVTILMSTGCASFNEIAKSNTSRRANISGTITTGPMLKMPSLESRGYQTIGIVLNLDEAAHASLVGITIFGNERYKIEQFQLMRPNELTGIFLSQIQIKSPLTASDTSVHKNLFADNMTIDRWSWSARASIDPSLLPQNNNIDAYLIISNHDFSDFIGGTNAILPPKGIYHRLGKTYAYGGFHVRLIDAKTGQELKNSSYVQATSRPIAVEWKQENEHFSETDVTQIKAGIKEVYETNVDEALMMLHIVERSK